MIIHLIGGRDDGTEIDTDNPTGWWPTHGEFELPLPEVLRLHSHPNNRTAYRMVKATPDTCTYQLDPALTATYRSQP